MAGVEGSGGEKMETTVLEQQQKNVKKIPSPNGTIFYFKNDQFMRFTLN